jgi:hypothetical protein
VLARLARVFLAVALLAAWQAALLHPLEHSNGDGSFVHLADSHSHDGDSDGPENLCDALAALTACAPDAQFSFEPPAPGRQNLPSFVSRQRLAEAPPFLAQGPPALL